MEADKLSPKFIKQVDKYIITEKMLGKGSFGSVFFGYYALDQNIQVAIKQIPMQDLTKSQMDILTREIKTMKAVVHKNIVRLYEAFKTKNSLYIMMEYCNGGNLENYIKKLGGTIPEKDALIILKKIVLGFSQLYQHNIIHRDIKPENILLHD